jgi:GntR family transcriptional regulator
MHGASTLNPVVDPTGVEPLYLQLAALLRRQITSGELGPGAALPSLAQLQSEHGVSSITARQALSTLHDEGLTQSHPGRGTYVRTPPTVRRVSSKRYAAQLDALAHGVPAHESAFTRDHGTGLEQVTAQCDFREKPAPETVAEGLDLPPGSPVLERRIILSVAGHAEQIRRAWYPLDLVGGTAMADPGRQPFPGGVIAELVELGVELSATDEDVRARMPTPDEAYTLRLLGGTPVLDVWRVGHSATGPVEVASVILPGDRTVLHYRLDF